MGTIKLDGKTVAGLLRFQKNEITEHHIYARLSSKVADENNSSVLRRISDDELRHYEVLKRQTGQDVKPNRWRVFIFFWISRVLGLTFGIKLMERGEEGAQLSYSLMADTIDELAGIIADEDRHEKELIALLEEEHLRYVGSIVLGLNDALVELTGTLAGLSFALQKTRLVALAGLITGIAASFSMAASEYLSTKSDGEGENPLKSSIYTGITYIVTVIILIVPFLVFDNYLICLALTIGSAILIILVFNYYISVAKDLDFKRRFFEMAAISIGVAFLSFGIGYLMRALIGIDA